jgi:hypothetical protein
LKDLRRHSNIVCVYVALKNSPPDLFYIFKLLDFQKLVSESYIPREEPKKVESFHHAFRPVDLTHWQDKWETLTAAFIDAPPIEQAT